MSSEHTLYLVATPIGHRDDIGLRALETLRAVTCVYAEDTRHSAPLLRHHGVTTPLVALHEHNERERADAIAERIASHGDAALISDAGTPAISDPGYRLVRACIERGVRVSAVPGASALLCALVVSGLPSDRFEFVGFAPSKGGARRAWLAGLADRQHTLVLYESPHRIVDLLDDIATVFGGARPVVLARELTKRFETVLRGSADELRARVAGDADQRRGEFVVLIGKPVESDPSDTSATDRAALSGPLSGPLSGLGLDTLIDALAPHLPPKTIARIGTDLGAGPKRSVYERVLNRAAEREPRG